MLRVSLIAYFLFTTVLTSPASFAESNACQSAVQVYTAIGDSITWGIGASHACHDGKDALMALRDSEPVEFCTGSTNYAALVAKALDRGCHHLQFQNLGISGATLASFRMSTRRFRAPCLIKSFRI